MENKKVRCIIYCRVSTDDQTRGDYTSIEAQEDRAKAFIKAHEGDGWVYTGTVKDSGYSGGTMKRPGLQQLLQRVRNHELDNVVVYKLDRLVRGGILQFHEIHSVFERHGVKLCSLSESWDTSSPSGRLFLGILIMFAEHERELARERTRDKLLANIKKGRWNGGMLPYGYDIPRQADQHGKLVINSDEAKHVRLMFRLYLRLQNISAVSMELQKRGIKTRVREIRTREGEAKRYGGKPFYKDRVMEILRNPLYIGKFRYQDELYDGQHEPIIDAKTYNTVQKLLDKNSRHAEMITRDEHVHALKGLIRCGPCEATYTPFPSGKKDPKTGQPYLYYACTTFTKYGSTSTCPIRLIPARPFENTIMSFLAALGRNSKSLAQAIEEANRDSNTTLKPLLKRRDELSHRRKKLTEAINHYLDIIEDKGLQSPELRARHEKALKDREEVDAELETLGIEIAGVERHVLDLKTIRDNLLVIDKLHAKLTMQEKKALCQLLIKRITVWPHDPDNDTTPKGPGLFIAPISSGTQRTRTKYRKIQVELYEVPGLKLPTAEQLSSYSVVFGSPNATPIRTKESTYRVACYIRTCDGRTATEYAWGLTRRDVLPRPAVPKPPRPSRMAELARLWKAATRHGQPDRKKFFRRHMGRVPSRAYMSKIAYLALRNGKW
jgi:site-specific DNA recombinase